MDKHIIVGVHIIDRNAHAGEVQELFTTYGCQIKTRLGLHEVDNEFCSQNGLILLEMLDASETCKMIDSLKNVEGIEVKTMIFNH